MTKAQVACIDVWRKCLEIIRDNIPPQSYKTWFEPIIPLKLDHNVLTIQVPSQFFYEWIEENYVNLLRNTLRHFLGPDAKLEYSIIIENGKDGNNNYAVNLPTAPSEKDKKNPPVNYPLNADKPIPSHWVMPGLKKINIDPCLNPLYTFDTFVEGDCNRLARNAGLDVADRVDNYSFNPLYIYGGFGQGKTHLANAIGNEVKKRHPNKVILYIQCEKFINQFTDSIKSGSSTEFVNFYQLIDVLIIDDIHFLANKNKTMETFFHVFNHLHQSKKVMIFTADVPPSELKGVEERLINRFKSGLQVELQEPDLQTRINILKRKMYSEGIRISDSVTEYIAEHITTNVRELEGAMISLIAQSSLNRKEIDIDLAASIVKTFVKNANREISIDYIQKVVSEYFEIPVEKLKEKTRKREVVQARQISMFFAKRYTNLSLKAIGQHFGGRDHSTVIHAITTVQDLMSYDRQIKNQVEEIQRKIQAGKN
jgi:chromosomal replication initiator protein